MMISLSWSWNSCTSSNLRLTFQAGKEEDIDKDDDVDDGGGREGEEEGKM